MIRALKYIFLFFLLLFVAVSVLLTLSPIQKKAVETIESIVFEATGMHVEMDRIALGFPINIAIGTIDLKDAQYDYLLRAKHATLSMDFSLIFEGRFPKLSLSIEHAKLYAIPPLPESPSQADFQQPELKLSIKELEINPEIFTKIQIPPSFSLHSLILANLLAFSSNGEFFITGEAAILGDYEEKALPIKGNFSLIKDQGISFDFEANYHDILPIEGTILVSSLMDLEGSEIRLPYFQLENLKEFNLPGTYQGLLSIDVKLSGPPASPIAEIQIISQAVTIDEVLLKDLSGRILAKIDKEEMFGSLILNSAIEERNISLNADFQWPFNQPVNIPFLNINTPGIDLTGNLKASFTDQWIEGKASGHMESFSFLNMAPHFSFSTPIAYELKISSAEELVSANFYLSNLRVEELTTEEIILTTTIENLSHLSEAKLHLVAKNTSYRGIEIENLALETLLNETLSSPFDLTINGMKGQFPFNISSQGTWQNHNSEWLVNLHTLSGTLFNHLFTLSEPFSISKETNALTLTPFSISSENSSMTGFMNYSQEDIQGKLTVSHLPLDFLPSQLIDFPIKGALSFDVSLTGSPAAPEMLVTLDANPLIIDSFSKIKPQLGELTFSLHRNLFSGSGKITSTTHSPVHFDLQFPFNFSLDPLTFSIDPQASLHGNIAAQGEIAPLLPLLLDTPTTFAGYVDIALSLAGTVGEPQINGLVELTDGSYEIPEIGVVLKDLKATIEAKGTQLQMKDVEATAGNAGKVFGAGDLLLDQEQHHPFTLEMNLVEAPLLNQDYVQTVCNGPLIFKGNSEEGSLSGQLQVAKASITIPERSYSTINTVEVTYVNLPKDASPPQSLNLNQPSWPLVLDIQLSVPRSLTIKGKDLMSTWKGDIAVQGQAKSPLLYGELKIIEGEYLFNGNPFALNQGTISFSGDLDKKTTLYVIANKDLDRVKIDVIAKGPIRNPAISFRSNPPLPQREILSWILFNRGTSEISSFQGAQLSESITNLSTNQQGPDILSKIRSTLGIDRFEICRNPKNDSNEVNVQVGKYISDNILISVIKSDVNRLALEATLTDKIKLQAQVGDDAEAQLLLRWKRDY